MNVSEAIQQACDAVGILPPRSYREGKWIKADTTSGKSGKGDGRIIVDETRVTAHNWQTGQNATVWLNGEMSPIDRRKAAERREKDDRERRARAERAATTAMRMIDAAQAATHPYFARKGFSSEKALVLDAATIRNLGGDYLLAGDRAIVMPARIGARVTSIQLIWEDGTKKFLAGGEIGGASHRIAKGAETWLCEGYATGLSLRAALKGLNRSDTILCCFSASNVHAASRQASGRAYIAADNDKPMSQFDGLGTGEYWARQSGRPFLLPPELGDINDMHLSVGIFAVQKLIATFLREARM